MMDSRYTGAVFYPEIVGTLSPQLKALLPEVHRTIEAQAIKASVTPGIAAGRE